MIAKSKQKLDRKKKSAKLIPEAIVNNASRTLTDADFPVGSVAHQGDLILVRIKSLPGSAKPRANRQMAEGSTQGSRHVVEMGSVYDCDRSEVAAAIMAACPKSDPQARYVGPVFQTVDGSADLVHPEHGHHLYRDDMTIAVYYQRNLDAEMREQRTQD